MAFLKVREHNFAHCDHASNNSISFLCAAVNMFIYNSSK
uniref:Uncharacterized protein n=1 Tax=Tetranychus urticae TaxID=32264 RepID=T1KL77_TETUR